FAAFTGFAAACSGATSSPPRHATATAAATLVRASTVHTERFIEVSLRRDRSEARCNTPRRARNESGEAGFLQPPRANSQERPVTSDRAARLARGADREVDHQERDHEA